MVAKLGRVFEEFRTNRTVTRKADEDDRCAKNGQVTCVNNRFQWAWTDLGANIIKLSKFRIDKLRFSSFEADSTQDGQMAGYMVTNGWKTKLIPECLFSHNPNPWSCCHQDGIFWHEIYLHPKNGKTLRAECIN